MQPPPGPRQEQLVRTLGERHRGPAGRNGTLPPMAKRSSGHGDLVPVLEPLRRSESSSSNRTPCASAAVLGPRRRCRSGSSRRRSLSGWIPRARRAALPLAGTQRAQPLAELGPPPSARAVRAWLERHTLRRGCDEAPGHRAHPQGAELHGAVDAICVRRPWRRGAGRAVRPALGQGSIGRAVTYRDRQSAMNRSTSSRVAPYHLRSPVVIARTRGQLVRCHRRLNGSTTNPAPRDNTSSRFSISSMPTMKPDHRFAAKIPPGGTSFYSCRISIWSKPSRRRQKARYAIGGGRFSCLPPFRYLS